MRILAPATTVPAPADATLETLARLNDPTRWVARLRDGSRPFYGIYRCACGTEKEVYDYTVSKRQSKSCGCLNAELVAARNAGNRYGLKHGGFGSREYKIWTGIISRCDSDHKNYGGRGIQICERWRKSFANFLADMGPCPSKKHSIDRFPDQNGNYEPGNCRWATSKEQNRNQRDNRLVTYKGRTQCISAWCEELGFKLPTLINRINRGWSIEEAFNRPVRIRNKGVGS